MSEEFVKAYTHKYATLGVDSDKVAINIKQVHGPMYDQLQFSVGVLKGDDLKVFTDIIDNINFWIYSAQETAENQMRNVFDIVSKIFKQ